MDVVEVDGSYGEGGGQILRTAIAFSVIQGRPVRIRNIRAGREVPGLRQQHASTLQLLARLFGADLKGAAIGSLEVSFTPGRPEVVTGEVDMKTAASITLLLQALIPSVALSHTGAELTVVGGTDVPWSPTFDYFAEVVRPAYDLIGIRFSVTAERRGYYPRGGGIVRVEIEPSTAPRSVGLTDPHPSPRVGIVSRCASLPKHVAERQLESMERILSQKRMEVSSRTVSLENADSPGSSALAYTVESGRIIGADALGARGRPSEEVGTQVALTFASAIDSGAAVDSNLADMIGPLLSISERESLLKVPNITQHLMTSLHVAKLFTGCQYSWVQDEECFLLSVRPVARQNA